MVREGKSRHVPAKASKRAAEQYDLQELAPTIHSMKNNHTRFLILEREQTARVVEGADKASINFHTDHSRGSLARVLTAIADGGMNLSKLQSFPIQGSDFKYNFHADLEFDSLAQFERVADKVRSLTDSFRILGVYKKGQLK